MFYTLIFSTSSLYFMFCSVSIENCKNTHKKKRSRNNFPRISNRLCKMKTRHIQPKKSTEIKYRRPAKWKLIGFVISCVICLVVVFAIRFIRISDFTKSSESISVGEFTPRYRCNQKRTNNKKNNFVSVGFFSLWRNIYTQFLEWNPLLVVIH